MPTIKKAKKEATKKEWFAKGQCCRGCGKGVYHYKIEYIWRDGTSVKCNECGTPNIFSLNDVAADCDDHRGRDNYYKYAISVDEWHKKKRDD